MSEYRVIEGDCLTVLRELDATSVQTCITSPPYFGLRDYGHDGQIGLEETPDQYVSKLVDVFREVRRVLRDDGTVWCNLGDSYGPGKQLLGVPWRVAFAMQRDGWVLRSDVIWAKSNPMPESVTDRPTKAHEYLFLLSKSRSYYYDTDSIRENADKTGTPGHLRSGQGFGNGNGREPSGRINDPEAGRNKRSVWTVATQPFPGAHFATFPPKLIEPCVLAGAPVGGTVLDPFSGASTTGVVATRHDRNYIGVEINPRYAQMGRERIHDDGPLLNVEIAA